jgi:hypothetical protein
MASRRSFYLRRYWGYPNGLERIEPPSIALSRDQVGANG